VSAVCMLALSQNAVAQCVGWQATAEARKACCEDGACPLHHHEVEAAGSPTPVTQTAADDCCAQSRQSDSSPSATAFASTITLAVLHSLPPVALGLAPPAPLTAPWETPSPPSHVPKYLLLSVLLV